jgi:hypothetical protein
MDSKRRTGYLVRQSSEHAGLRASLSTVYNPFADGYARMSQNDPGSAFNLPLILLRQCRGGEFLCHAENGIVPRGTRFRLGRKPEPRSLSTWRDVTIGPAIIPRWAISVPWSLNSGRLTQLPVSTESGEVHVLVAAWWQMWITKKNLALLRSRTPRPNDTKIGRAETSCS